MTGKRRTPSDNGPELIKKWLQLHREYTESGLSNYQSYRLIATSHHCSWECVRYWCQPEVRLSKIRRQKNTLVPYSKKSDIEKRRIQSRISKDIYRHIDAYIKEVYGARKVALSLDDITDCLHKLTGVEMRNNTVLKAVSDFEIQHGKKILIETENNHTIRYMLRLPENHDYVEK
jgi:hypothetical protein